VVRAFREPLLELLDAHCPDFLICNEVSPQREAASSSLIAGQQDQTALSWPS
jgi:hypothetical protein